MSLLGRLGAVRDGDRGHAIARNLRVLLNAKRGYGGTRPGWGLSEHDVEVSAGGKPDGKVEGLVEDIQALVEAFEPRLTEARVRFVAQDGADWVRLRVEGIDGPMIRRYRVRFNTILRFSEVMIEPGEPT